MEHKLKIYRPFFQAVIEGRKTFEIRDNRDREFNTGDTVLLEEIYPEGEPLAGKWSGRSAKADIAYVTNFMQQEDYVVFSIKNVEKI